MDSVASLIISLAVETGKVLHGSVYVNVKNAARFHSNLHALEKETEDLIELENKLILELQLAEKDGKVPTRQVKDWLKEVKEFMLETSTKHPAITASNKSICGCCFNCSKKCRFGTKVVKMRTEVRRLIKAGSFPNDAVAEDHHQARSVEHIPGPSIEDQTTASKTMARITNLMHEDKFQRIGIWGMGGVGKTTLVKNLNNKLKGSGSDQPFGSVIWATVSKDLDLKRVQTQIADRLNITVKPDETVERIAIKLYQRLEKEKNFLLILDDVWETIDLHLLGVPMPEDHAGSKIILTSRFLEVCRAMKTDVEVRVDVLTDEEAWRLFCQNVGDVAFLEEIRPFAEAVAKECSGLPLAIIAVGTAMRKKRRVELWVNALKELQRSVPRLEGIENKVYKPLKLSYDSLEGNNIKSCFLYCALFPEDFSIEESELVRSWLGEGLIEEETNYEDSFNRGIAVIEILKDSCLLENGERQGTVKMHDVVRDVAVWIASSLEEGCKSLIRSGKALSKISEAEFDSSLKRISFVSNKLMMLPDCVIQCQEASTLLLQGNFSLETVPERFLIGFQALRVLNLSGARIRTLPSSLLQLDDLRALLLRDCYYLEKLPPLGHLTKLQTLDLCATSVVELPEGMENLCSLSQVSLARTHYLKTIRSGIMSRLNRLEVVDMTLSDYHWGVKGEVEEGQAAFEELGCLERLLSLSIRLKCIPCIGSEDFRWINKLKKFQLFIGLTVNSLPTRHDERRVIISGFDLSEESIGWLLTNATSLVLNRCQGLNQMLQGLAINTTSYFAGLKSLTIASSNSSLRPEGGCSAPYDLLPNLEELYLQGLSYLESISELVGHLGLRFPRLRSIQVTQCSRLKNLLSYGRLILSLPNLEEMKVSFCQQLDELFNYLSKKNSGSEPIVPKLRMMELKNLPKLRTLCTQKESWQHLEQVEVTNCNLLWRLPLTAQNASTMREIKGELRWWSQLQWEDNEAKSRLEPCFRPTCERFAAMQVQPMCV